jgi:hypothetical protein
MSGDDKLAGRNSRIESQSRNGHAEPDLIKEGRLFFLEGSESVPRTSLRL